MLYNSEVIKVILIMSISCYRVKVVVTGRSIKIDVKVRGVWSGTISLLVSTGRSVKIDVTSYGMSQRLHWENE